MGTIGTEGPSRGLFDEWIVSRGPRGATLSTPTARMRAVPMTGLMLVRPMWSETV
jgi:hypothetical protein